MATQKIDVDGSFELKVVPNGPVQYAFLQVGTDCADFFIERDKDLEISFIPQKEDPNKPTAFNERQFFIPKVTGGKSAKLNEQILAFNDTLDGFLESIYPMLRMRKSPGFVAKQVGNFEETIASEFTDAEPFVKDYVKYSIAGVEQTFLSDRERLYQKYLKEVRPEFGNPVYTDFMLQFFQGVVFKMVTANKHEECKEALKGGQAFSKLEDILLETEPRLENTQARRLVLIDGLGGLFGQQHIQDKWLVDALEEVAGYSSNSVISQAAKNVVAKYTMLAEGSPAPEIRFMGADGDEQRLSDHFGTYLLLELTDVTNPICLRESGVLPSLNKEFQHIAILTIAVGNSEQELEAYRKRFSATWPLGRAELSNRMMVDYDIRSVPRYYIIGPEGEFSVIPAPEPSRGLRSELQAIEEQLKRKTRGRVGY